MKLTDPNEPFYVAQSPPLLLPMEREAWLRALVDEVRDRAKWCRATFDEQTSLVLLEAWETPPVSEGAPRFDLKQLAGFVKKL